jgi:hypothetical protein
MLTKKDESWPLPGPKKTKKLDALKPFTLLAKLYRSITYKTESTDGLNYQLLASEEGFSFTRFC